MAKILKGANAVETHGAILDLIRSCGEVSRIELANRSGLTPASISRIVKQLIFNGLIIETGFEDSTGGKRRTLIQLNASARHAVGISVDAVNLRYLVIDLRGQIVGRYETEGIGDKSPAMVIKRIAEELDDLLARIGVDRKTLVGIGVASAGRVAGDRRLLRTGAKPEVTEWELSEVEDQLRRTTALPAVVENDATCAAIGEFWVGRYPAGEDFATLYLATGFGLGLMIGGDIYQGASANAGEIGHLVIDIDGPACWCGGAGCLEALAAPRRVVAKAVEIPGLAEELALQRTEIGLRQDFAILARAAAQGHPACLPLIKESARYLATALLSITNLLDLDRIILSGPGFEEAGPIYLDAARALVDRVSFMGPIHPVMIGMSKAGQDAAALGAAAVVLHGMLMPHRTTSRIAEVMRAPFPGAGATFAQAGR